MNMAVNVSTTQLGCELNNNLFYFKDFGSKYVNIVIIATFRNN